MTLTLIKEYLYLLSTSETPKTVVIIKTSLSENIPKETQKYRSQL